VSEAFEFDEGELELDPRSDRVVQIPQGIRERIRLFDVLRRKLPLPDYFGENWDALEECLKDLSWIDERRVVLIHQELPHLGDRDLATYLEVLAAGVEGWKPGDEHELVVVFPDSDRETIETTIGP